MLEFFKKLFSRRKCPSPVGHDIETPPIVIGCVAKQIINDLNDNNADKWKIHYGENHKSLKCSGKEYVLQIWDGWGSCRGNRVKLLGARFIFFHP